LREKRRIKSYKISSKFLPNRSSILFPLIFFKKVT
jgi:hypothetical protein